MSRLDKVEKVKLLAELFELVQYYYEYRDQPIQGIGNFHTRLKDYCNALDIDFVEFKKEFKMNF